MTNSKNKTMLEFLICVLVGTGLFAAGYYADIMLLLVLVLFIPMVFSYLRARSNELVAGCGILVFGVLVLLMAGLFAAVIVICATLAVALLTGYIIQKKVSFYFSALVSCIAVLVGMGVVLLCVWLFYGSTADVLVLDGFRAQLEANPEVAKLLYVMTGLVQSGDATALAALSAQAVADISLETAVAGLMRSLEISLTVVLPQLCASVVALFGLIGYIIPRACVKKVGGEVGTIPAFSMWCLPKRFGTWSVVFLLISWIGLVAGWNNFQLVYTIVFGVLNVTYSIQGMAFADWLLKKKIDSAPGRGAIVILTFLLGSIINLYMWIGFFEQIAKLRKRELVA